MHCTENPIYVLPEMKLCGLILSSYIHESVNDLNIPRISLQNKSRQILGIYKSQPNRRTNPENI
jgi:hypothetical protein